MAAQIHFGSRRKPAEIEIRIGPAHHKRGFGEVQLGGDALHPRGVSCRGQQTHGRGVAGERPVGKGIDVGQ